METVRLSEAEGEKNEGFGWNLAHEASSRQSVGSRSQEVVDPTQGRTEAVTDYRAFPPWMNRVKPTIGIHRSFLTLARLGSFRRRDI